MLGVARSLIASGVQPGDRVAVWAPNSAAWISAALGALAARAWLVPLNTRLKGDEASYILRKTDARVSLRRRRLPGYRLHGLAPRAVAPDLRALADVVELPLPGESGRPGWDGVPRARGRRVASARAEASISGRLPRRRQRRHLHIGDDGDAERGAPTAWRLAPRVPGLRGALRAAGTRPIRHTHAVLPLLRLQGRLDALAHDGSRCVPLAVFDATAVLELIARERITHMPGPPTMFSALLDHPRRQEFDLSTLDHAIIGAASIPSLLVRRMRDELEIGVDPVRLRIDREPRARHAHRPRRPSRRGGDHRGAPARGHRATPGRRRRPRGAGRERGGGAPPGAVPLQRLLRRRRGDAPHGRRRLAAHRRRGPLRRGRLRPHHRPQEGHVHRRRVQRRAGRGGDVHHGHAGRVAGGGRGHAR